MAIKRRKFSDEEKQAILDKAGKQGITAVLYEHHLSYSVFSRWRSKFMKIEHGMPAPRIDNRTKSELKHLLEENARLKKIIADQALEMEQKDEELKKLNTVMLKDKNKLTINP